MPETAVEIAYSFYETDRSVSPFSSSYMLSKHQQLTAMTCTSYLQTHDAEEVIESSNGEGGGSSAETAPEPDPKIESKRNAKKKIKKNRQPRIIKLPPEKQFPPPYTEEDFKRAAELRKGTNSGKRFTMSVFPDVDFIRNDTLATPSPKIERSGSFRKLDLSKSEGKKERRENAQGLYEYNIVLLGDLGVGKTALAVRFVTRRYLHEYDPQLERTYVKNVRVNGTDVSVRLHDTVDKRWDNCQDQADAFIMLYSVTSEQSYLNATNSICSMRKSDTESRTLPIMLAGNKCDLENARVLQKEDPEVFAQKYDCLFKEITVADTMNVDGIIKPLIRKIQEQNGGRMTPSTMNLSPTDIDNDSPPSSPGKPSLSRKVSTRHAFKFLSKKKEKL